jgi:hypothetical protein
MKYVGIFLIASNLLIAGIANAKCAAVSTRERFAKEAESVVLVEIVSARAGSVPDPYFGGDSLPGLLLKLRVLKSWKGPLHSETVIDGWTFAPQIEHAYPSPDVGTKIIVFFQKASEHDVLCCNSTYPARLSRTAEELDAIVRGSSRGVDPNNRWNGPC